jgi:hypothetical protein
MIKASSENELKKGHVRYLQKVQEFFLLLLEENNFIAYSREPIEKALPPSVLDPQRDKEA